MNGVIESGDSMATTTMIDKIGPLRERALKALEKRLTGIADALSGRALQRDVDELAMAIARLGGVEKITADQKAQLVKRVEDFARAGAKLPTVLQDIWLSNLSLAGSLGQVSTGLQNVIDTTDQLPELRERWRSMFGEVAEQPFVGVADMIAHAQPAPRAENRARSAMTQFVRLGLIRPVDTPSSPAPSR